MKNNHESDKKWLKCKHCGFIFFGQDPETTYDKECLGCGNIPGIAPTNAQKLHKKESDIKSRILCRDGNWCRDEKCLGFIGKDGKCKECGRPATTTDQKSKEQTIKDNIKKNTTKCSVCGKINFSWKSKCTKCGNRLTDEGSHKKTEKVKNNANHKGGGSGNQHQKQEYFIFRCLTCAKSLRVAFPFKSFRFRCTDCNSIYDILIVSSGRSIYLITPKLIQKTADEPPPAKPPMPEAVKKALHLFNLSMDVSWADVRTQYRKCMSGYHPDKVEHLGVDLKKLAQEKTTKYNVAFNIIKKYFEEVNKD